MHIDTTDTGLESDLVGPGIATRADMTTSDMEPLDPPLDPLGTKEESTEVDLPHEHIDIVNPLAAELQVISYISLRPEIEHVHQIIFKP